MKILIIEDDPGISEILKTFLKIHELDFASSQRDAYKLLADHAQSPEYDLVLLDLWLPRKDVGEIEPPQSSVGLDILRSIRGKKLFMAGTNAEIPVLVMTAYKTDSESVELLMTSNVSFISKPFKSKSQVLAKIDEACQGLRHPSMVWIAFHPSEKRVWIDGQSFEGAHFELLKALRDQRHLGLQETGEYQWCPQERLMVGLGLDEEHTLRRRVSRFRDDVHVGGKEEGEVQLSRFAIIETKRKHGYRLNPATVAIVGWTYATRTKR